MPPKPFKYKCLKCGYSKVIKPNSDVASPSLIFNICPKCNSEMEKYDLNIIENFFIKFIKNSFGT